MPRYFFDVVDNGQVLRDDEGMLLPGIAALHEEVMAAAREVVANEIRSGGDHFRDRKFRVRDEAGNTVLTLPFVEAAP